MNTVFGLPHPIEIRSVCVVKLHFFMCRLLFGILFVFKQLNLNKTLSNMVRLIIQQSAITDSIDLWGTLNTVSEALGNVLWVVSHLMDGQYFDGNNTKASVTQGNFTVVVGSWPGHTGMRVIG